MNENPIRNVIYSSQFSPHITALIAEKRGMGHKYNSEAEILRQFDCFVNNHGFSETVVTKSLLEVWSVKRPHESDKTHQMRFYAIQNLSKYMVRLSFDSYVSPLTFRKNRWRFRPYIFTDAELDSFLKCASNLAHSPKSKKRHIVFSMLFMILICAGLRLSEALKLRRTDVTFSGHNAILYIHDTKFDKDRTVPLSLELSDVFVQYLKKTDLICPNSEYVFPAKDNGKYSLGAVYYAFRFILWKAGISHGGRGKGPRIHDFRHTFAVKSLRKMALSGTDTLAALPLLCKYMGHKNMSSTQTYLTLTAELFPHITQTLESTCGNIVPRLEVSCDQAD